MKGSLQRRQELAAQRRENELQKAAERLNVAKYYDRNTRITQHYETWSTKDYYEKAKREAESYMKKKERESKLVERRSKLELMFYKENQQYDQEIKLLQRQPKLFKNGSYVNVNTNTDDINIGIADKERSHRLSESALAEFHRLRTDPVVLKGIEDRIRSGHVKNAWMDTVVEHDMTRRECDSSRRRHLKEKEGNITREIEQVENNMRERETKLQELKDSLERNLSAYKVSEEQYTSLKADETSYKNVSREVDQHTGKLRDTIGAFNLKGAAYNYRIGGYKLRMMDHSLKVIDFINQCLDLIEKVGACFISLNDVSLTRGVSERLEYATSELKRSINKELENKKFIEQMYDGEARLRLTTQVKIWQLDYESRSMMLRDLLSYLKQHTDAWLECNRTRQRDNVLERDRMLAGLEADSHAVRSLEGDIEKATSGNKIAELRSALNSLKLERDKIDANEKRQHQILKEIENLNDVSLTRGVSERLEYATSELKRSINKELENKKFIEQMYDGEARLRLTTQVKIWQLDYESRSMMLRDLLSYLKQHTDAWLECNRTRQRDNVLERDRMLAGLEADSHAVRSLEGDIEKATSGNKIAELRSALNSLKLERDKIDANEKRQHQILKEIENVKCNTVNSLRTHRDGMYNWRL